MIRFRLLNCLALALLLVSPFSTALAAEMDSTDLAAQVDELFAGLAGDGEPGAAVAVIRNGEIVYQNGYGLADLERGVAITPESVFEIGSVSKQFTAMCILLLENDGKLTLDDDIRDYVPELPPYERPITIRQLLHHTSGIRDIETLIPLAGMHWFNYYPEAKMLDLITRQKGLNFPPGEQFRYSNSGYTLLAEVVSRVSGQSLREFARLRIFEPLGMKNTAFWDEPGQLVPNRALAYAADGEGGYRMETWNLAFAGPAGVYSSVGDLALWDANFYDNQLGGGADLIETLQTPGVLANGEQTNYAAGLSIRSHKGLPVITHGGAWMGYRAELRRYPEQKLSVVLLLNAGSRAVRTASIAELYLEDEFEPPTETEEEYHEPTGIDVEESVLAGYEGSYWSAAEKLLRTIEVREGKLHYVRGADSATELGALADGSFFMVGVGLPVSITFRGNAASRTMTFVADGEEPLLFEAMPEPSEGLLADYAGRYWSEELQRELRISADGKQVLASWADEPGSSTGRLVSEDELVFSQFVPVPWYPQDVQIRFERDEGGAITGFSLSCDMVHGIVFGKRAPGAG